MLYRKVRCSMLFFLCVSVFVILYLSVSLFFSGGIRKTIPNFPTHSYCLFYTDQKTADRIEGVIYSKVLTSNKYNIHGKPDYIFKSKRRNRYIPVELKSGSIGEKSLPNEGDLMQLIAYFLIIEDVYAAKVPEGRLIYSDAMFIIRNKKSVRRRFLKQLDRMRSMLHTGREKVKPGFAHCRHCVCRETVCEFI